MGSYYEVFVRGHISRETVKQMTDEDLAIIRHWFNCSSEPVALPNHPLFENEWNHIMNYGSYYVFPEVVREYWVDDVVGGISVCGLFALKDGHGVFKPDVDETLNLIGDFYDYMAKWFTNEFVGYYKYEYSEQCVPVYVSDHKPFYIKPNLTS